MNKTELKKEVATLAKRANQRLREIEKQGLTKASNAYRYIETLANDKKQYTSTTKKGEIKFDTSLSKKSYNELSEEYAKLNTFLNESKTSTIKGIKAKYQKAYDTFKENNPNVQISFDEYGDLWRAKQIDKAVNMFGSNQAVKIYEQNDSDIVDKVIEQMDENQHTYSDFLEKLNETKEITTN